LDQGWVTVGIDYDAAQFAVTSIRAWWEYLGQPRYPNATRLQITADCGGSNGNRTKPWKEELQKLADDTELEMSVCHFPPGTSKWNRIGLPTVQLHHHDLAWQSAGLARGDHQLSTVP
jgi:hypothetical protein